MIFAGECEKGIVRLCDAVSVRINQEINVPADDVTVVFPYIGGFPSLQRIYILQDGCNDIEKALTENSVFFKGIVDEQVMTADADSAVIKIFARSMAALLLDNECQPMMYNNPSADVICAKHIEKFGIEHRLGKYSERKGEFSIAKGSSHYKAVSRFCSQFLDTVPRIDGRGIFRLDVYDGTGSVLFDNSHGVRFESISVCQNRYSRISKVFLSEDNGYDTIVSDSQAEDIGIARERYLNLSGRSDITLADAENIISIGKRNSLSVTLVCSECLVDMIGYQAVINAEGCEDRLFVIQQVKYSLTAEGEKCRVKCVLKI